jgi:hypothetical protein
MARPTIYSKEMIAKTKQYIEDCNSDYVIVKRPYVDNDGKEKEKVEVKYEVNLPTIEGLAYELDVHKDTIYAWRKEKPEFSYLIERLLSKQAKQLVNKGLSGDYNSTIAKVILTKHGYREGTDITTNDKDLGLVTPESKEVVKKAFGNI